MTVSAAPRRSLRPHPHHSPKPVIRTYKPAKVQVLNIPRVVWYTFIAMATIYGLLQTGRSVIENGIKLGILLNHQTVVQRFYHNTVNEHGQLLTHLRQAESPTGLEAMARNKLEWVGDREVLVRTH